jgi:hypothetical protein
VAASSQRGRFVKDEFCNFAIFVADQAILPATPRPAATDRADITDAIDPAM